MSNTKTALPRIVTRDEWRAERERFLAKEKAHTRARDALNAERRRLPMWRIDKDYVFDGPDGRASLADLFAGRRQLMLYHFMFGLSVFLRDDDGNIHQTYFTQHRGVEYLGSSFSYMDLAPYGRQEDWEDSPEGWPQGSRYAWWRHHDRYED